MHWYGTRATTTTNKMTVVDGSTLLTLTKWSDEGHYLRDFLIKHPQLPQIARVLKGQYLNVGVPSLASSSLSQAIFLCSKGKRLKVAAQCVKFKEEGRKVVLVGPKLAIPDNYDGWFEILSEEGRAVRCIESVSELARRFPDSCLVREAIKAYVARGDDLETITDKVRTIAAGETLVLVSEVLGTSAVNTSSTVSAIKTDKVNPSSTASNGGGGNAGRFLRCFDARGENVYLGFEQKGKFSIVAKEDNISGVHSIKNLMSTKRFPIMVRLVSGKTPVTCGSSGKSVGSSNFVPELRLFATFEEECVMAMSMQKEQPVVAIPLTASLKLQGAKNADVLYKTTEFARLNDKCKGLIHDVEDKIQIIIMSGSAAATAAMALVQQASPAAVPPVRKLPYFRRAFSDPQGYVATRINSPIVVMGAVAVSANADIEVYNKSDRLSTTDKDDTRYDEIDQIYDYVRGFAPPPKLMPLNDIEDDDRDDNNHAGYERGPATTTTTSAAVTTTTATTTAGATTTTAAAVVSNDQDSPKPDPPPIATIPVRRYPDLLPVSATNNVVVVNNGASNGPPIGNVAILPILIPPASLVKRAAENIYERIPRKLVLESSSSSSRKQNSSSTSARYYFQSRLGKNKIYVKGSVNSNSNLNNNNAVNINAANNNSSSSSTNLNLNNNNNNYHQQQQQQQHHHHHHHHHHHQHRHLNNNQNNQNNNNNNRQSNGQRSRLFRQNKNSFPVLLLSSSSSSSKEVKTTRNGGKCSTASPIFNIRYKSLTNLAVQDFNTLESSNSGGGNSGSYIYEDDANVVKSKPKKTTTKTTRTALAMVAATKLPRPKSLSNLVKDLNQVDVTTVVHNRVNILNSAYCSNENSSDKSVQQMSSSSSSKVNNDDVNGFGVGEGEQEDNGSASSPPLNNAPARNKRLGTLYL